MTDLTLDQAIERLTKIAKTWPELRSMPIWVGDVEQGVYCPIVEIDVKLDAQNRPRTHAKHKRI